MTRRKIQYWVLPPQADAEFAAAMEEVLEVSARPYDARYPVLCMEEQPIQLLKETRQPIAGTKKHPRRVDYEYERAGTASIFMFCEPLLGWRQVSVRVRRTKVDWALALCLPSDPSQDSTDGRSRLVAALSSSAMLTTPERIVGVFKARMP